MQIVEIAKSVSKNAKILIMDEPTAPLTVDEVKLLFKIIRDLKAQGVTIIYISHRWKNYLRSATGSVSCGTASMSVPWT